MNCPSPSSALPSPSPISQIFEITQPEGIEITLDDSVDILCYGDATGSIDISVSGGTPTETSPGIFEYNYSWVGPSGFTSNTEDISLLVAGENLWTLYHFKYKKHFIAGDGERGGKSRSTGANGRDIIINVPIGTIVKETKTGEILLEVLKDQEKKLLLKGGKINGP